MVPAAHVERGDRGERQERVARADRSERIVVQPPRRPPVARSQSYDRMTTLADDFGNPQSTSPNEHIRKAKNKSTEKLRSKIISVKRSDEETIRPVKLPEFKGGGNSDGVIGVNSSDSSESGSSLLCPLAPRWLAPARRRGAARRRPAAVAGPTQLAAAPVSTAHQPKDTPGNNYHTM